jgi:ribosomal protein L2
MISSVRYLLGQLKKKTLIFGKNRLSGRNKKGFIIMYHRGGGCKKLYRFIDFYKLI